MGFPMTFPRELGGEKGALAIRSQSAAASLSIRHRRLRRPSAEHGQRTSRKTFLHPALVSCRVGRQRSRSFRPAIPLHTRISWVVMQLIYAAKKPNLFSVLILLR